MERVVLELPAGMIEAGEDTNFIARRVAICAAEDVGNADSQALVIAMAAVQAVQFIFKIFCHEQCQKVTNFVG